MPLKAILFDFDGVIADTDNHHIAAWQRTLSAMGWQVVDEVAARAAEIDDRQFLAELFAKHGFHSDKIEEWVRRKQALTVKMLRDSPRLYPGVADLIRKLHGRVRLAVVSGTWRENIQAVLESSGLAGSLRDDRRQRGRDIGKTGSRSLPSRIATAAALQRVRRSPSKTRPRGWRPHGPRESPSSPSAIVIPFSDWVGDATYISGLEPIHGLLQHLGLSD